jgi:hypothetical protein
MAKIIRLVGENFKRIRAIEITPTGNVVQIRGANGAGKSSVLDAIAAAVGGERLCPEIPIKRGEDKASVTVETEDLTITRRWTSKGSYLEVAAKDGSIFRSPQRVLDALTGSLSFDPLSFTRFEPAKQLKLASELVGVDLADLDADRRTAYDERTVVNREAERLAAQVPAPVVGEVPDEEESLEALLAELEAAENQKRVNEAKRTELALLREEHKATTAKIAELKADLATEEGHLTALATQGKTSAAGLAGLKDPDIAAARARALAVQETNGRVRQKKDRLERQAQAALKKAEALALTTRLAEIEEARAKRIAAAKFPVEGLGLGDAGLTLNGLPFEQASSAEKLRVSLAMGLALNPKLKIILIRDGSLLDEKSLALVTEMAAAADAQVWLEMVSTDGGPVGILIEDGMVAGAAAPSASPKRKRDAPSPDAAPSAPEPEAPSQAASSSTAEDNCPF